MNYGVIRGTRVLVTGGAGFIGTNLVRALLDHGAEVVVLDNLCNGLRSNLPENPALLFVEGDVQDQGCVESSVKGCDVVFHQAAIGSVPRSMKQPLIYYDNNVKGTAVVFEAARAAGVRRVVWASSSSVYGDTAAAEKREGEEGHPISPYAASKSAAETIAKAHALAFQQEIVGLRYFNVYGPFQRPDSDYAAVVPLFLSALASCNAPTIYGDGEQVRDFSFIGDVVNANLRAAYSEEPLFGEIFNVSGGRPYSVNQLLASAAEAVGAEAASAVHVAKRKGDIQRSKADLTKIGAGLGYQPTTTLTDGLRMTVQWFRSRPAQEEPTPPTGAA